MALLRTTSKSRLLLKHLILHLKGLVKMTAKSSKQQTEMLVSMLIKPNRIKTVRHFQQNLF